MQYLISEVIPTKRVDLDYDGDNLPHRWWAAGRQGLVIVEPNIEFGDPVIRDCNVPTRVLANTAKVEKSTNAVARMYGITVKDVDAAIEFERRLEMRAAA